MQPRVGASTSSFHVIFLFAVEISGAAVFIYLHRRKYATPTCLRANAALNLQPMNREFWDDRYRQSTKLWSGNPNPQLVKHVQALTPGLALDVGAGEGGDAIWLAQRGWRVTALDFSQVALDRAKEHANAQGEAISQAIDWNCTDLHTWQAPQAYFNLVSVQFMHLPSEIRRPIYRKLASSVAVGGYLLIVGHHPLDLKTTIKRPSNPDVLFTERDLVEDLDAQMQVIVQEASARTVNDADGNQVTVHDTVVLARRK